MEKGPRSGSLAILAEAYDAQLAARGASTRPWGRALRRWHVVSHVVWPIVGRWWDPRSGEHPSRNGAQPGAAAREHLRDLVGKHWDDIDASCQAGVRLSEAAVEALAAHGVRVTPGELSERVAVRVGRAYREHGSAPGIDDLSDLVTELVASFLSARSGRLAKAEFRRGLAEYYEQEWQRRGADSLAAFRPSSVGLGDDVRPALAPSSERGGWDLGLRRSVWGRYRLFSDPSAASRSVPPADETCGSHHEHERLRDLRGTDQVELGREEVRRTCSPYGLNADEHRGVVLAISQGLDLAESVASGPRAAWAWREWTKSRCAPLEAEIGRSASASRPDPALVAAVRDYTGIWRRSPAGELMETWYGSVTGQLDLVLAAVARKTWMDLHRREREHLEAMRRAHVVRAIRMAYCKGVPEAFLRRRHGRVSEPGTDEEGPDSQEAERYERTVGVLLDHHDEVASWRTRTLSGDLGWIPRYEEIAVAESGDGEARAVRRYLTGAELARILGEDWSDPA